MAHTLHKKNKIVSLLPRLMALFYYPVFFSLDFVITGYRFLQYNQWWVKVFENNNNNQNQKKKKENNNYSNNPLGCSVRQHLFDDW